MDWLVFADDWGAHPSTTQHLIRNLPATDRVLWVDSLGMRAPRLDLTDLRRIGGRLTTIARGARRAPAPQGTMDSRVRVVQPRVLPWHHHAPVISLNRWSLAQSLGRHLRDMGVERPYVLLSNPVGWLYLNGLPRARVAYLRLDDYPRLPGVDPALVAPIEQALFGGADVVVATARSLLPADLQRPARYLPQGVDWAHFATAPLAIPDTRVLGFFGMLADWIDWGLVEAVAAACPDWTLEFVGPGAAPDRLRAIPNIRFRPAVPYAELPRAVTHWRAAWIPFEVSTLTRGVNPLKLREYLAAGLPAACTPLPEAAEVEHVGHIDDAASVREWLARVLAEDEPQRRAQRRAAVESHGWTARAAELRRLVAGTPEGAP